MLDYYILSICQKILTGYKFLDSAHMEQKISSTALTF